MLRKIAATLIVSLLALGHAVAQEKSAPAPQPNVKVTIRLGKIEQGKRNVLKTYDLVVAPDTTGSKLLSGSRVPIPTGSEVVYQNIGFSCEAMVWLVGDGKIKLAAKIEDSRLSDKVANAAPFVETRQLSVNAVLTDGKPMEVTKVEGAIDPSGFVEVEAAVLK
ncbi:MAG TPA: hypothetical protein VF139_19780 [Candidatus Polarisedimenticolaceae bacterium]